MTKTTESLAQALDSIGLDEMAARAAQGFYHDFQSPLATPAMQLAADLAAVGTPEADALRKRHLAGEFDATNDEDLELGSTGRFPDGQVSPEDEGELRFAISSGPDNSVKVDFGKPVAWFSLPRQTAIQMGLAILKHAGVEIESQNPAKPADGKDPKS